MTTPPSTDSQRAIAPQTGAIAPASRFPCVPVSPVSRSMPKATNSSSQIQPPVQLATADPSDANLLALIENTQDAIWSLDARCCLLAFNSVFQKQFKAAYNLDVQAGMNLLECLPHTLQEIWSEHYHRALTGESFSVELRYDLPDKTIDVEISFSPILDQQGIITGAAVFSRDITDRKRAEADLQEAKDQLQAVLDAVPGCVSWFSSDLRYLGINRYLAATFNLRQEDFIGKKLGFMESSPGFAEFVQKFVQSSVQESSVEIAARVDDEPRSYLVVAQKYAQDQAAVFVGLDITERRQFEEALRESQERYALAVQGANDGLWDWNLRTNEIYFSPRWKAMLGYGDKEIGNSPEEWFSRIYGDDLKWLQSQLTTHLQGLSAQFEVEHRIWHKDGSYRWMLSRGLAVRDQNGVAYRMAGSQTDITERKRAEEQLLHDAFHDGLTGLSNRALFLDRLGQAIERSKRQEQFQFAVLFLDVDRFKVINDSLGHRLGDELLITIGQRLEGCLRPGDTLARLGGDEFALLIQDIDGTEEAVQLAEQIHDIMRSPFDLAGQEIFVSVSIGIALRDGDAMRPDDLLRNADTAMYQAKAIGRARHAIFNTTMHTKALALLRLETDLRRAIATADMNGEPHDEFQMRYQPIIYLPTEKIAGFEALVRWHHPERGMVSPAEFVPVTEETGLIIPLGQWIFSQACHQLQRWYEKFPDQPLSMSINLSPKQFAQADLVENVQRVLETAQILNNRLMFNLKLEVTEGTIMQNPETSAALLRRLKELGVTLLIDDFGTGYSSLSYLHRFPFDTVKIDQSFVKRIGIDSESEEIVRAITTLAHNLNMTVVAEGVETFEQMIQLKEMGAEYGQGYFFAKPLSTQDAEQLLTTPPDWEWRSLC